MIHPVLINGRWVPSQGKETFRPVNPATEEQLSGEFPVSPWSEISAALDAAAAVSRETRGWPGSRFASFLECYASGIESIAESLVEAAHQETALPV
ncbi:MAG: aldehyde dehydrogenase (NADP(+)), partial [Phycisphaerae bacterium]